MSPTEQGRFCLSCQKEVIDFASMTDIEIIQAIARAGTNMCGRVEETQLQRIIAAPPEKKRYTFKYLWSMLLGASLISKQGEAQSAPAKPPVILASPAAQETASTHIVVGKMSARPVAPVPARIKGLVTDEQGEPIAYASIILKGTSQGVAADSTGHFVLELPDMRSVWQLEASAIGFVTASLMGDNANIVDAISIDKRTINLTLKPMKLKAVTMGEVVVTSPLCQRIAGGMTIGIRVSALEKAGIKFKDMVGINEIKAFPNPIAANSQFTLRLQLKAKGDYVIQFTHAGGKIIASRQLTISSGNQTAAFDSRLLGAAGIYFASITHQQTLKTYTTRLLVQ